MGLDSLSGEDVIVCQGVRRLPEGEGRGHPGAMGPTHLCQARARCFVTVILLSAHGDLQRFPRDL